MWRFSGYRFRLFCENGVSKEGSFSEHVNKGNCVRSGYNLVSQIFAFGVCFSPIFSGIGYHLKAKILEPGRKMFFVGTSP